MSRDDQQNKTGDIVNRTIKDVVPYSLLRENKYLPFFDNLDICDEKKEVKNDNILLDEFINKNNGKKYFNLLDSGELSFFIRNLYFKTNKYLMRNPYLVWGPTTSYNYQVNMSRRISVFAKDEFFKIDIVLTKEQLGYLTNALTSRFEKELDIIYLPDKDIFYCSEKIDQSFDNYNIFEYIFEWALFRCFLDINLIEGSNVYKNSNFKISRNSKRKFFRYGIIPEKFMELIRLL